MTGPWALLIAAAWLGIAAQIVVFLRWAARRRGEGDRLARTPAPAAAPRPAPAKNPGAGAARPGAAAAPRAAGPGAGPPPPPPPGHPPRRLRKRIDVLTCGCTCIYDGRDGEWNIITCGLADLRGVDDAIERILRDAP